MVPIPGYTRFGSAESAARAAHLVLTDDQKARLDATKGTDRSVFPD